MKRALIADGRLCDIVAAGAEFPAHPSMQWVDCPDDTSHATHQWDGAAVVAKPPPPPPPVPTRVTMRQARLALLGAGLLPQVDAAVAAIAGTAGDAARIEWEYALTVERNSALVASLTAALALTEAQLDALFTQAAVL